MNSGPITVHCPDCGSELTIDADSGQVLDHRPAPARARSVDLERSQELLQRQERERDQRFRASVEAEKQRESVLAKKFEHSMKRVRDNPGDPRPLRDLDLD